MRQLAVVRQKQQPLRILIEPSDRKHADLAQLRREQVQHRSAPPILGRAQHARRLMQHDVGVPSEHQLLPVDRDAAALRVILLLRAAGDPPVHQHAALAHERLDLAARPASRRGDELVQPFLRHTRSPLLSLSFLRPSYHTLPRLGIAFCERV